MQTLVLSDIHANLEAFKALLRAVEFDRVWVLGDLVGYGANPNEVIDIVRDLEPELMVRGNHDKACAGITEPESFSDAAKAAVLWTRRELSSQSLSFLRALEKGPAGSDRWLISHGSPRDEDEYLLSEHQLRTQLYSVNRPFCFFGHTHVPLVYSANGGDPRPRLRYFPGGTQITLRPEGAYLINPGSVGQPRDEDPRAAAALIDTEELEVRFLRVEYPAVEAAEKIIDAGLPEILGRRLLCGR